MRVNLKKKVNLLLGGSFCKEKILKLKYSSCWAFAVVASIEAQYFKKTNRLIAFSEQNLVDCDTLDNGCNGGWPTNTYKHIIKAGGIDTMAFYPVKTIVLILFTINQWSFY